MQRFTALFFASFFAVCISNARAQEWEWRNPLPTNVNITGIEFVNSDCGWMIGDDGLILRTRDGGESWETLHSPLNTALYSICFVNSDAGWIGANHGNFMHTTDGGDTWSLDSVDARFAVYNIEFVTSQTGWMRIPTHPDSVRIWKTQNGGAEWQIILDSEGSFRDIEFVDESEGWLFGSFGGILHTSDGGLSWEPQISGTTYGLRSACFFDREHGLVASYEGRVLITSDGGEQWNLVETEIAEGFRIAEMSSIETGWLLSDSGRVYKSVDGGET